VADIWFFPAILLFSGIGCLLGTFFAPLENFEAVKAFYKETRPWGWWGPVREAVMKDDPGFQPNRDFHRDVINILVGMVWQMAQVVIPMYLMVKDHTHLAIWTMVLFVTTWLLKKYWWDQLDEK